MSVLENNKAIARRFLDLITENNLEELSEMVAPTWRMYGGPPNLSAGPAGLRELFATFGNITQQWTIEDMIAEGDKVAVRATNTCLQDSFFGIPSYGKQQTFTATFIHHIAEGKVIATWRNADDLGRVLQLGARIVPGPG